MTLTEIMKACEVENGLLQTEPDTPRAESKFTLSNLQITERLQVTNDLIKELALHVKQLSSSLDRLIRDLAGEKGG